MYIFLFFSTIHLGFPIGTYRWRCWDGNWLIASTYAHVIHHTRRLIIRYQSIIIKFHCILHIHSFNYFYVFIQLFLFIHSIIFMYSFNYFYVFIQLFSCFHSIIFMYSFNWFCLFVCLISFIYIFRHLFIDQSIF